MSLKQVFFRDSFIYGFTSYLGVLAAFILTPIYTRFFSKEEYGVMDLINTWNNFFILIIPLGLTTAILRTYGDFEKDPIQKKKNLGTLLITMIFSGVLYVIFSTFYAELIENYYFNNNVEYKLVYISYGIILFTVIISYFQSLNRIQFKVYRYLLINLIPFLVLIFLGYYLSIELNLRIAGFFYAAFISTFIGLAISVIFGYKNIHFQFDRSILKKTLNYSLPLLFVIVFLKFTFIIDRLIINNYLDLKSVGDYSIAIRIGNILQILVGGFTAAWFPFAMSKINEKDRDEIYNKGYRYYILIFSIITTLTILFTKEILLFFAPAYLNVDTTIYFILPSVTFGGLSYFFGIGMHIIKKTKYFIISSFLSFITNLGNLYGSLFL